MDDRVHGLSVACRRVGVLEMGQQAPCFPPVGQEHALFQTLLADVVRGKFVQRNDYVRAKLIHTNKQNIAMLVRGRMHELV